MIARASLARFLAAVAVLASGLASPAFAQTFSGLLSGSWWDASRAGEGQFITFESTGGRNVAYVAYFTYTANGAATWQVGSADYAAGARSIDIPLVTGSGPRFGTAYRPGDLATTSAGTATLEFVSCSQMRMRHSAIPALALNLTRLVGPLNGSPCVDGAPPASSAPAQPFNGLLSGSWWDASRAGEGQFITFESTGGRNVAYLAYFTYTANGTATWHVGSADYATGAMSVDIPLVTGSGPRFGTAYRPGDLTTASAGTATLDFVSCGTMRMRHSAIPGLVLSLTRLVGPLTGSPCVDAQPPVVTVSALTPFAAACSAGSGVLYANAEVEPSLAVHPGNPNQLVALWQQDRWSDGSARGLSLAVSRDGGATWTSRPMPFSRCAGGNAANGGDFDRATDPWVSVGPDGTAWAMSLSTTGASFTEGSVNAMLVSRSTDGGQTWSRSATLISDTAPYFNDKNAITADPFDARYAYAVWDRLRETGTEVAGPALLARTTDAGATWEAARVILDPGAFSQTIGNLVVAPTAGALVNFAMRIDYQPNGDTRAVTLVAVRSPDRGLTWSAPVRIADSLGIGTRDPETGAPIRDGVNIPQAAAGPDGSLHVVWQDARFSGGARDGVAYSRSNDGGITWSAPVRVNPNPAVAAFTPSVHVLADGTLGVTYFDLRDNTPSRATLPTGYWLARSTDGGRNWVETRLAGPFDLATAPNARGLFLGDYMSLAGGGGAFMSLFARTTGDAGNPTDVFFAKSPPTATAKTVGAWSAPWTAAPAQAVAMTEGWRSLIDEAVGRVLDRRGRRPPR